MGQSDQKRGLARQKWVSCLGDTSAGYAGLALYSSDVWVTPLLDMLARPRIPPMSG